jgi:hypothetical protein
LKLDGWIPIRVYWREDEREPRLDWCLIGETRFIDPFFDATIQRRLSHPFHHAFRRETTIAELLDWQASHTGVAPKGFIFHMSRCGSTLAAQMLAAIGQNIVLSEAAPLDSVLRAHLRGASIADEERVAWFRAMVGALGQRRSAAEEHLFVKFDCWNIAELPIVRLAFPDVPWIFLYRNPLEVLASHLRTPGGWTFPAVLPPAALGLQPELSQLSHHEYLVRALARICELALAHLPRHGGLPVNYLQLPDAAYSSLPGCFGICYKDEDVNLMREAARNNAKMPGLPFEAGLEKRLPVAPPLRELAARWLDPLYRQLESSRAANHQYALH